MYGGSWPGAYPGPENERVDDVTGWGVLRGIMRGIRADAARTAARPGTDCPIDGTTLRPGRNGRLHCPFDGWTGTAAQAMPRGPATPPVEPVEPDLYESAYASTY